MVTIIEATIRGQLEDLGSAVGGISEKKLLQSIFGQGLDCRIYSNTPLASKELKPDFYQLVLAEGERSDGKLKIESAQLEAEDHHHASIEMYGKGVIYLSFGKKLSIRLDEEHAVTFVRAMAEFVESLLRFNGPIQELGETLQIRHPGDKNKE